MTLSKKLLFVGAHPDDESFGPGGTLAHYALQGAKVYYACATRGEVGAADPEHLQGFASPGDMRWSELTCAGKELGLTEVIHLGYRDSGMAGSPDNQHPECLVAAPLEAVVQRVVKVIRDIKPQVIYTFDPIGGYRHPDHIAIHNATVKAFHVASDAQQYPEAGPAYQPQKLYFSVFSKRLLKTAVRLLPLFGRDPKHFGRNGDIDLLDLAQVEFPIHATIHIANEAVQMKERASACHKSQLQGGPPIAGIFGLVTRVMGTTETFMRAYPEATKEVNEKDLFEGVQ